MGTVCGLRTRRYHGLLVISGDTPATRRLGLAALDPVVELPSGARVPLGAHEWLSGAIEPAGYELLERFDLTDGLPRWRWRIGPVVIERELAMVAGSPTLGVVHRLLAGGPIRLRLAAMCTWRDAHGERYAGEPPHSSATADGVVIEGAYRLAGPGFEPGGVWHHGVYLREEAARGLPPVEDLWYAGSFAADLAEPGDTMEVTAFAIGAGRVPEPVPARLIVERARVRARDLMRGADDETDATLRLAADAFVVTGPDVVAGYPWFGTWSRDTMISFPGLFLATGRHAEGRELLLRYAESLSDGMLPNTADTGHVEYNTIDGTLWFIQAIAGYIDAAGDHDTGTELLPAIEEIVATHIRGTRYGIRVDPGDCLLYQGMPGYALTWMDARIGDTPVTPRIGKPVEVNALWINALRVLADLRRRAGIDEGALPGRIATATTAFRTRYPAPTGWLYDVIDGPDGPDASLRPNQLLAYSLPRGPLHGERPSPAIATHLLTPLGLRTLAPDAPGYRPRHRGAPAERDAAYHQGTVWPWMIGPFGSAQLAAGFSIRGLWEGLTHHLRDHGLGSISETADGSAPHGATGCPFQAWSVAELLRVRRTLGSL